MEPKSVTFNGIRFTRHPNAESRSLRVYYNPPKADRKRGIKALHREVYKAHHGPIPKGYHVHHRDGNPFNNDPANLEAVSRTEHAAHHRDHLLTDERRDLLDRIRPLASEWHGSEEGREWHSEHGRRTWDGRERQSAECRECGETYATYFPDRGGYCSQSCTNKAGERNRTDDEDRQCKACGETFRVRRSKPTAHCSKKCAWVTRRKG